MLICLTGSLVALGISLGEGGNRLIAFVEGLFDCSSGTSIYNDFLGKVFPGGFSSCLKDVVSFETPKLGCFDGICNPPEGSDFIGGTTSDSLLSSLITVMGASSSFLGIKRESTGFKSSCGWRTLDISSLGMSTLGFT